jgi:hypothetical protein
MPAGHNLQIATAFKKLQQGIRNCGLDDADIPKWAVQATTGIAQLLRDWKAACVCVCSSIRVLKPTALQMLLHGSLSPPT